MKQAMLLQLAGCAVACHAQAAFAQATVPRAPVIADFGACLVRQAPAGARALMATAIDSREEQQRARRLAQGHSDCLNGRAFLSLSVGEIRGTVAEALLESDSAVLDMLRNVPARPAGRAAAAEGRAFVANYAHCLVEAETAKATRLLATGSRSAEERQAMLAFGDTLNDCVPEGYSYRVDTFDVRAHIAVRLYELAREVRSVTPEAEAQ